MIRPGNIGWIGSIILVTILLGGWMAQGAELPTVARLECPRFAATLQLERPSLESNSVAPLNVDAASSEDSSSWVPRILIPVAAVVVVGTATYLIFSVRG